MGCLNCETAHFSLLLYLGKGQRYDQLKGVCFDFGGQNAAMPLGDFPHTGQAESMVALVLFCCVQIGGSCAGYRVFHAQHQQAAFFTAADSNVFFFGRVCGFHGVVKRIAQQGTKVGIRDGQCIGERDLDIRMNAKAAHILQLGGYAPPWRISRR